MAIPAYRYRIRPEEWARMNAWRPAPRFDESHPLAVFCFGLFFTAITVWFCGGWVIREVI